jgi:hypothetical protein
MHTQFRNKNVDGRSIIKYFGCCSFKPAQGAKQISPASKIKWVENWHHYWFYHTVPLVEERNDSKRIVKRYSLAAKMSKNAFDCKPEFPSSKGSRTCEKIYKIAAIMQSARDFYEEYIAARIWPLKKGWSFVRFHEKMVRGKSYIFPDNESFHPKKYSEDVQFVSAVETKAVEILGKFLKKEKDLMDKILGKDYKRLNRVFDIAQIKYGERPLPAYTRTVKPSIENVTKKKRADGQLSKKITKKKKVATPFGSEKLGGNDEEMGQETLRQLARDKEVRMISLVLNSSGLTPLMLTPLVDCFQNLEANVHCNVNLGEATLPSSPINVGEDILSSTVIGVQIPIAVATAEDVIIDSQEEGEVAILAS